MAGLALAAWATSATGAQKFDPGVTAKTVHIGGTFPFSGVAALYSAIPTAERAYFLYANAHGGVNGRKIQFTYYDDSYDPSKSVPLTQKLVEQDKIFADFGSLGTAPITGDARLPEQEEGAAGAGRDRRLVLGRPGQAVPVDDRLAARLPG